MSQNPHGCSDGGCVFRLATRPVGVHTNAGCRCIPLRLTPNVRVKLREAIRSMAEELESAGRLAVWIEGDTLPEEPGFYWIAGCDRGGWPAVSLFETAPIPDPGQPIGISPLDIEFVPGQRRIDIEACPWEPLRPIWRMTHYQPVTRPKHPASGAPWRYVER